MKITIHLVEMVYVKLPTKYGHFPSWHKKGKCIKLIQWQNAALIDKA